MAQNEIRNLGKQALVDLLKSLVFVVSILNVKGNHSTI